MTHFFDIWNAPLEEIDNIFSFCGNNSKKISTTEKYLAVAKMYFNCNMLNDDLYYTNDFLKIIRKVSMSEPNHDKILSKADRIYMKENSRKFGDLNRGIVPIKINQPVKSDKVPFLTKEQMILAIEQWDGDSSSKMVISNTFGDIENWNTSYITDMSKLFLRRKKCVEDLSKWDVSNVTDMSFMFGETWFNKPLPSTWNTSNVINMHAMFIRTNNPYPLPPTWNTSNVKDMGSMFWESYSNHSLPLSWNTSSVIDMSYMFNKNINYNQPFPPTWDISNVINMSHMFANCIGFNSAFPAEWNTSNVKNMSNMFYGCVQFNQPIFDWDTSNVELMDNMFEKCLSFNQSLNEWNISKVVSMNNMFKQCSSFNQVIHWDITNIRTHNILSGSNGIIEPINHNSALLFK